MSEKWNSTSARCYRFEPNTTNLYIPCWKCNEGIKPAQGAFTCHKTRHTFCSVEHLEQNLEDLARIAAQVKFYVVLIEDESAPAEVCLFSKPEDAVKYANHWAKSRAEDENYLKPYHDKDLIYGLDYCPEGSRVTVHEKVVDNKLVTFKKEATK